MKKHPLSKWVPSLKMLMKSPNLRKMNTRLKRRGVGTFNRHTVAGGIAIGLFVNFLPIPFQIFWAAFLALLFSVNLPIAVSLTWVNNPFTFIPINFFIYKVGSLILRESPTAFSFPEFRGSQATFGSFLQEFMMWLGSLGKPYLLGVVVVSVSAALAGYCLTQAFWTLSLLLKKNTLKKKRPSQDK